MRYGLWALGLAVIVGGLSSGGCATIVSGTTQAVTFQSSPQGATVTITREVPGQGYWEKPSGRPHAPVAMIREARVLGTTPFTLQLDRATGWSVLFEKEGHTPITMPVTTNMNPAVFGNIFVGGVFGTTTDSISGAAFEYTPNQYLVMLNPLNTTSIERSAVVPQPDRVRLFILHRHKDLRFDLSRGFGEDLASLLSLLSVAEPDRQATSDRLRLLMRTYPDPMVFADHVLHLDLAAK